MVVGSGALLACLAKSAKSTARSNPSRQTKRFSCRRPRTLWQSPDGNRTVTAHQCAADADRKVGRHEQAERELQPWSKEQRSGDKTRTLRLPSGERLSTIPE